MQMTPQSVSTTSPMSNSNALWTLLTLCMVHRMWHAALFSSASSSQLTPGHPWALSPSFIPLQRNHPLWTLLLNLLPYQVQGSSYLHLLDSPHLSVHPLRLTRATVWHLPMLVGDLPQVHQLHPSVFLWQCHLSFSPFYPSPLLLELLIQVILVSSRSWTTNNCFRIHLVSNQWFYPFGQMTQLNIQRRHWSLSLINATFVRVSFLDQCQLDYVGEESVWSHQPSEQSHPTFLQRKHEHNTKNKRNIHDSILHSPDSLRSQKIKEKFKSSQHPLYTFTVFNQERRRTDVTLTFLLI